MEAIKFQLALVLSDIYLEPMDGIEFVKKLRALPNPFFAHVPVILMTAETPTPAMWKSSTPLIADLQTGNGQDRLTSTRLWNVTKRFFKTTADAIESESPKIAEKLRRARPHWTRHTHATHALARGAELTTVRDNLRHASISRVNREACLCSASHKYASRSTLFLTMQPGSLAMETFAWKYKCNKRTIPGSVVIPEYFLL